MHWRAAHGHSELLSHCFWTFPFNFSKLYSPFSESGFSFMDFKLLEQEHNLCVLFCYCSPYYTTMLVKVSDPEWKVAQNDLHISMLLRPPECQACKWAPRCSAQHLFFLFFLDIGCPSHLSKFTSWCWKWSGQDYFLCTQYPSLYAFSFACHKYVNPLKQQQPNPTKDESINQIIKWGEPMAALMLLMLDSGPVGSYEPRWHLDTYYYAAYLRCLWDHVVIMDFLSQ